MKEKKKNQAYDTGKWICCKCGGTIYGNYVCGCNHYLCGKCEAK